MLQTHKYRRPKWIKFPRSILEDERWFNLSVGAKALWIDVLIIAAETADNSLPPTEMLINRLRISNNRYHISSVSRQINELIQCGFLTKCSPELQSYRVKHTSHSTNESGVIDFKKQKARKERESAEEVRAESKNRSSSPTRPQTSMFLRLRESARVCWGDRAAAIVGAAYHHDGLTEEDILATMREVVDNSGNADELAHDLWVLAA